MINYISEFFKEFEFTSTERVNLVIAYERMRASRDAEQIFFGIVNAYDTDMTYLKRCGFDEMERVGTLTQTHTQTCALLLLICLTKKLRERLAGLGMTKRNIHLSLCDLKYKMRENEKCNGIVGTDKFAWYPRLFIPNIFAIGRLQFEISTFKGEYYICGEKSVTRGSPVLSVHIPASGEPLDSAACAASYREAKKFFTRLLGVSDIPFFCSSWLLAPINSEFLGEKSNIVKFASKYDIIDVKDIENTSSLYPWIFDAASSTPAEKLPRDTTLRRAYATLIDNGGRAQIGTGIFFLDDPKAKAQKQPVSKKTEE